MKTSFKNLPIGVCLALETIAVPTEDRIDESREIPQYPDILPNIEKIYIDIQTLARDVVWSIETDTLTINLAETLLKNAINEITNIPSLIGNVVFFNSYYKMMNDDRYVKTFRDGSGVKIKTEILLTICKRYPMGSLPFKNSLIYSNNAYFLAKLKESIPEMYVLRGHTGTILTNKTLNKLYNTKNKDNLPFNHRLVKLIGDGKYIKGADKKTKDMILAKAEKDWKVNTSNETIMRYIIVDLKIPDK